MDCIMGCTRGLHRSDFCSNKLLVVVVIGHFFTIYFNKTIENQMEQGEWARFYEHTIFNDPDFRPDPWQRRVLEHQGDITIRAGRQVGKSTIVSKKAAKFALENPKTVTLIIAAAQRQSSLLFEKTMGELMLVHRELIKGFKENPRHSIQQNIEARRMYEAEHGVFEGVPTKTEMRLKNGSRIYSLPAGKSGIFIRGLTIDLLIADEAAFIPEPVWISVIPMLAIAKKKNGLGWEILISTPFGKGGHFYETHHDPDFMQIHVNSEQCSRIPSDFLRKEKGRLNKVEYAQEYLGEFTDVFNQYFSTELVKKCMTFIEWKLTEEYKMEKNYYLGVDIARYGEDENAFVVLETDHRKLHKIVRVEVTQNVSLTDTIGRVQKLNDLFKFKRIFVDDTGIGGGVTDSLVDKLGASRVTGLNNAQKTIDEKSERKGRILKEDLYTNALQLMERQELQIIANLKLLRSLKSMTYRYTEDKHVRIEGKYSHLSEAFVRALWALKDKKLKLFIA